jgi:hypothetical protein
MGSAIVRTGLGYAAAVAIAAVTGSVFHTQSILARLSAVGADIPLKMRVETTVSDFLGLAPQYGLVVAIALAVGFVVAALAKRLLKPLAPIAYPLAGAAALGAALALMAAAFDGITPIAGARGAVGFGLQCLAGGLGGLVFAALTARRAA